MRHRIALDCRVLSRVVVGDVALNRRCVAQQSRFGDKHVSVLHGRRFRLQRPGDDVSDRHDDEHDREHNINDADDADDADADDADDADNDDCDAAADADTTADRCADAIITAADAINTAADAINTAADAARCAADANNDADTTSLSRGSLFLLAFIVVVVVVIFESGFCFRQSIPARGDSTCWH